ncbi:uncharacterized protein LOC116350529 [Contarinia nasturtii]|uniref:uncharacterized protein LOC116350529 n=1 Tax=Contarinia nasturtii TaxID=265458 RepID=UPI0012D3D154|nr:uncharacterized protein LOC116350529 [Contarinia nasturtii]
MLSNNLPFKKHESGDRGYIVKLQGKMTQIQLSARAVNGLIKFNTERRNDVGIDKKFLKALLIGICTLKRIKESVSMFDIDNAFLGLVKDMFAFSVADDENNGQRLASFEQLVEQICTEIRNNVL